MQTRRTASFSFLVSVSPHQSPCTIWSGNALIYNTIWWCSHVRYDLVLFGLVSMYDINLGATHTTILSIGGVTIPIYLVSSTTDSIRQCIVLFKPVPILTSDPKSEFLCQSSLIAQNPTDSPEPPCMPGTSPMPPSPRITHTVTVQVLLLSTWSRSSVCNKQSDLVVACQLKSSWAFNSNVTQVFYWYSLNTRHCIILSKQGYTKVDGHLPRRVVLVVDCIIQEVKERSYCTMMLEIVM